MIFRAIGQTLLLIVFIELISLVATIPKAKAETNDCLTTAEVMSRKLSALSEEERALCKLKIPGRPVLGEVRKFNGLRGWVAKSDFADPNKLGDWTPRFVTIETTCTAILDTTAYIFVEKGVEAHEEIKDILYSFPQIKKNNIKIWGSPGFDVDGDPGVFIVISDNIFYHEPEEIVSRIYIYNIDITFPGSNCAETIFIRAGTSRKKRDLQTFLSHEYNHLLVLSHDYYDEMWIFEGLGYLSAYLLGHLPADHKTVYLDAFLNWKQNAKSPATNMYNHISVYQFFNFLYKHYGLEAMRKVMRDPCDGKESIAESVGEPWDKIWLEYEKNCREEGLPINNSP